MPNHQAIVEQVALYLGNPWKFDRRDEPSSWRYDIIDGSGRGLYFWLETGKTKYKISGHFPNNKTSRYSVNHKSIGVSFTRPPKDIAADIARRLLPHYFHAFEKAKIRFCEEREQEQEIELIAHSLVQVTGGYIAQHYGCGQKTVYFNNGEAQIYGYSREVNLKLSNLTAEQAIKIAALVSTLPDPTKYKVQHHTLCDGWINTWSICENDGTDITQIFDTEQEAQAELDEFFREIAEEIKSGERQPDNGYDREDFRIVPVQP